MSVFRSFRSPANRACTRLRMPLASAASGVAPTWTAVDTVGPDRTGAAAWTAGFGGGTEGVSAGRATAGAGLWTGGGGAAVGPARAGAGALWAATLTPVSGRWNPRSHR